MSSNDRLSNKGLDGVEAGISDEQEVCAVRERTLRWTWVLSVVLVFSAVAAVAPQGYGDRPKFILLCGLLLMLPISIFSALALSFAPSLRRIAAPTLLALNTAAIGSLLMAWRAPTGDDAFAFVLYIAISLVILVVSFAFAALLARRRSL